MRNHIELYTAPATPATTEATPIKKTRTVAYIIWRNPYMTINQDSYINRLLEQGGFKNAFSDLTDKFPKLTRQLIEKHKPEFVFLSTEPYPFRERHIEEARRSFPTSKIVLVDGELISWYGTRMGKVVDYFNLLYDTLTCADE